MIQGCITKFLCYYRNIKQRIGHYSTSIIPISSPIRNNRSKFRPPFLRSVSSLVAICFFCATMLQTGCSKIHIPDYPHKKLEQYQYVIINEDDLSIAISPLLDSEESLKYFEEDLLSKNILAVYVEVENKNPSSSYVLFKDKISIANATPTSSAAEIDDRIATVTDGRETMEIALFFYIAGIIIIPLMLVGAGILLAGASSISDASEKRHNLTVKELQTQTLSPGEGTNGFIYFDLTDTTLQSGEIDVNFKLIDLNNSEARNMALSFNWEAK